MSKICAWIGHKYQARFDTTPGYFTAEDFPPSMLIETIKRLQKKVYVHDVCERCGSVVSRDSHSHCKTHDKLLSDMSIKP